MNKAAIAEIIHEKMGGTKVSAEQTLDAILTEMVSTLQKGGEVSIAGLGIFSVKPRAARTARNPKTGEAIQVKATTVPKFRAAKAIKVEIEKNVLILLHYLNKKPRPSCGGLSALVRVRERHSNFNKT